MSADFLWLTSLLCQAVQAVEHGPTERVQFVRAHAPTSLDWSVHTNSCAAGPHVMAAKVSSLPPGVSGEGVADFGG